MCEYSQYILARVLRDLLSTCVSELRTQVSQCTLLKQSSRSRSWSRSSRCSTGTMSIVYTRTTHEIAPRKALGYGRIPTVLTLYMG